MSYLSSAFTATATVGGYSNVSVLSTANASGVVLQKQLISIKFNAPLKYAAQGRAVTPDDYKPIVPTVYSNIKSIQVWGGEDNEPFVYGQVYISIKPNSGSSRLQPQRILSLPIYNNIMLHP